MATISRGTTFIVTGTSDRGCEASDSIKVDFINAGNLEALQLPTAFTPNGDGLNDCFGIKSWGSVEVQSFTIYNRWGDHVFDARNASQCWDGTYRGVQQATGAFPYVLKVRTVCGDVERKGIVLLVR